MSRSYICHGHSYSKEEELPYICEIRKPTSWSEKLEFMPTFHTCLGAFDALE